jgi:hypothetical protein
VAFRKVFKAVLRLSFLLKSLAGTSAAIAERPWSSLLAGVPSCYSFPRPSGEMRTYLFYGSVSGQKHSFDIPFMELEKVERWAKRQLPMHPANQ